MGADGDGVDSVLGVAVLLLTSRTFVVSIVVQSSTAGCVGSVPSRNLRRQ